MPESKEAASKVVQRIKKQMEKDDNAVVGVEKADVQAQKSCLNGVSISTV